MPDLVLNDDERDVLVRASDYDSLAQSPGWNRIFAFLQKLCVEAEGILEQTTESEDDHVIASKVRRWQERERIFQAIQQEIQSAIRARDQLVKDFTDNPELQQAIQMTILKEEIANARSASAGVPGN